MRSFDAFLYSSLSLCLASGSYSVVDCLFSVVPLSNQGSAAAAILQAGEMKAELSLWQKVETVGRPGRHNNNIYNAEQSRLMGPHCQGRASQRRSPNLTVSRYIGGQIEAYGWYPLRLLSTHPFYLHNFYKKRRCSCLISFHPPPGPILTLHAVLFPQSQPIFHPRPAGQMWRHMQLKLPKYDLDRRFYVKYFQIYEDCEW